MNLFYEEHRLLLRTLISHQVSFLLIGGYAVNYHGYNRSTADMDIWLKPDNDNKESLLKGLLNLGFNQEGINSIRSWDFRQPHKFRIGHSNQPDCTEFMTHISGIEYKEADEVKLVVSLDGLSVPLINIHSLIKNKKASGRLRDLADVEALEKILLLKGK